MAQTGSTELEDRKLGKKLFCLNTKSYYMHIHYQKKTRLQFTTSGACLSDYTTILLQFSFIADMICLTSSSENPDAHIAKAQKQTDRQSWRRLRFYLR